MAKKHKPRVLKRIDLSEPGMYLSFIPNGTFPELSFVYDDGATRKIGIISRREDLILLKEALKDVV